MWPRWSITSWLRWVGVVDVHTARLTLVRAFTLGIEHDPDSVAAEHEFHAAESKCWIQNAVKEASAIEPVDGSAGTLGSGCSRAIWWTRMVGDNSRVNRARGGLPVRRRRT